MAAPAQPKFFTDVFSQEGILLILLFTVLSSPQAYKATEPVLGRNGMVNIVVHGIVLVILAQMLVKYIKAHPVLNPSNVNILDSRLA
jgi:hypothetical protein